MPPGPQDLPDPLGPRGLLEGWDPQVRKEIKVCRAWQGPRVTVVDQQVQLGLAVSRARKANKGTKVYKVYKAFRE